MQLQQLAAAFISCLMTHYEAKNNTILNYSSATSHGSTKHDGSDERQKAEKFQP